MLNQILRQNLACPSAFTAAERTAALLNADYALWQDLAGVGQFCHYLGRSLRSYQLEAAEAIVRSIRQGLGQSFVVLFPRQSGKNMLQAQLEAYLLVSLAEEGGELVKFSPTYQPQSLNAMRRLEEALEQNLLTRGRWQRRAGNHFRFGRAGITFLSAAPGSNVVGATASTLLELDEAQDIEIGKYDKQIAPMAASTNATRIFWGTAWTSQTLLARELRAAEAAQERDGCRRVFRIDAERVRAEVPAYGAFVDEQINRLGRGHPMVRSQFFSEEIDLAAGLFNAARLGLMQGRHSALDGPRDGQIYAMLIDLAGEDEGLAQGSGSLENPERDATAITIVEVDLNLMQDALMARPRYKVVWRAQWLGEGQVKQYARILALAERWQPARIAVDATGVGAGLAAFLTEKLGSRVLPVQFSQKLKSKLGWGFLSVIDTGRFQDFKSDALDEAASGQANPLAEVMRDEQQRLQALFARQLLAIEAECANGPERILRWAVPEGARDNLEGGKLRDDLAVSAAMVALLDELPWGIPAESLILPAPDPIEAMNGGFR